MTTSTYSDKNQPQELRDYLTGAAKSPGIGRVRAIGLARWEAGGAARLLDAGCGNGEFARELAGLLPQAEVTAVDHSADAIAEATRGHDGSSVKYEIGDLLELPFENDHFDGVRSERVFQHLSDHRGALAELVRVTKPGGRVSLIDTDWDSLLVDGSPTDIGERSRALIGAMAGFRTPEAHSAGRRLRRWMIEAGLTDVDAEPVTLAFTSMAGASGVLPLHRDSPMVEVFGSIFGDYVDAVEQADADGTLLITLTIWVVTGRKPA